MTQLKFSLIICTLGERIEELNRLLVSLENQTYKNFEVIIVSQCNHTKIEIILKNFSIDCIHLKTDVKGLSKSRNIGLSHVSGDFATVSDDDCWYPVDCLERVNNYCSNNSKFSVLCFKIYDPISNVPYKTYKNRKSSLKIRDIGRCSSIEIFFRTINYNKQIRFDERFGLGAIYPSGEENIFLADLLAAGNEIIYIPDYIVYHREKQSSNVVFNKLKMETAYFMFKRIFGPWKSKFVYFLYFVKHFFKIENKLATLFFLIKNSV